MAVPNWNGYPPNPEKDGWHWVAMPTTDMETEFPDVKEGDDLWVFLTRIVVTWSAAGQCWALPDGTLCSVSEAAHRDENGDGLYYYSPCYSKDDLNNV